MALTGGVKIKKIETLTVAKLHDSCFVANFVWATVRRSGQTESPVTLHLGLVTRFDRTHLRLFVRGVFTMLKSVTDVEILYTISIGTLEFLAEKC